MDSTSYAFRYCDNGINFPTFSFKDLDEWVIFHDFLYRCGGGEFFVTIGEFIKLYDV